MLLPLRFVLDLGAVLVVRHALAARREPPAAAPFVPEAPLPSAVVAWVGAAGRVAAIGCALLVYFDFLRFLVPVLVLGPLSLLTMAAAEDRLSGYRWRLPRPSLVAWRRPEGEFLILVLAVAALYRFGPAGTFPPVDGFASIEEMQRATGGARILEGARPWEFPLAQYIAATSFALFGKSIHSLRLPVTLLAWLTLPLFYLVARQIVARPAALFATALLAVSRWHCQIGWYAEDVYVPLFPFVLLLYLLLRTRRAPRPSFYIACGALAGYMLYDYAAYRPAIAVALGFFAADALWQRRRPEDLRNIALMVFVTALFTPPLVAVSQRGGAAYYTEALSRSVADEGYYTSDPYEFVRRRVNRIRDSVDAFTYSDHTRFFASLNVPRFPLLDPFTAVFFTLGFGATLLQPRRRYYGFFAATFLVLAAGGMVVPWNFDFRRFAVLIPFAFLFIAFVTHEFDLLALGRGRERLFRRALALVALGAAAWNAWFLFAILAPNHAVRAGHRTPYSVPLAVLGEHYDAEYVVLLSPDPVNFFEANDYDWLKPPGLSGQVAVGVEDILPIEPQPPSGRDVLLLIARPFEFGTVIEQVRDLYPGVECEVRPDPDHKRHDLAVCRIPEGTVAQPRGFTPQLPSP
jgi:4-amino-4-deoxy-L-arabinose transferase-like glycosyltransferase